MNSQQEYDLFMAKLNKAIKDLSGDFAKLSPENKLRVERTITPLLRGYGCALTIEEILHKNL